MPQNGHGKRKFYLGLTYLVLSFGLAAAVVVTGNSDLVSAGVFATGAAAGLGVVVWGNAQEHKAQAAREG